MRLLIMLVATAPILSVSAIAAERYHYRTSEAYAALDPSEQKKLDQVDRDFVLLWGALDMYAEHHYGQVPKTLAELVPTCLKELPNDPFATDETAKRAVPKGYVPSLDGRGYRYCPGIGNAFAISSVGLKKFPYLAEKGNIGLYTAKGHWAGGRQWVPVDSSKKRSESTR